jgi:hypothetical protein
MNFQDIAARFEQSGSGSDSFKVLSKSAFDLMKEDPENAALYYLIGVAAKSYVRTYEDQAVTEEVAERAKAILCGYGARIREALAADASVRFSTLSDIAIDYEWKVSDF